jgi:hypothetical protein
LEKANLLAKATGHSFRQVVSRFRSGEGFGKIGHDAGLKLGKIVSRAHRSTKAAKSTHMAHAQSAHGKSMAHRGSASAHESSLHRASAVSHGNGHTSGLNSLGHSGLGPVHSGASHSGGHGHGGR